MESRKLLTTQQQLPQRERYEDEMIAELVLRERLTQDKTRGGHAGAGGAEYLFAKYLFDVRSAAAFAKYLFDVRSAAARVGRSPRSVA
jgi:hypothetical protein